MSLALPAEILGLQFRLADVLGGDLLTGGNRAGGGGAALNLDYPCAVPGRGAHRGDRVAPNRESWN